MPVYLKDIQTIKLINYQIYDNKSKYQKTFNLKIAAFNLCENLHNIIKAFDRDIFFVKNYHICV